MSIIGDNGKREEAVKIHNTNHVDPEYLFKEIKLADKNAHFETMNLL